MNIHESINHIKIITECYIIFSYLNIRNDIYSVIILFTKLEQ